MTAEGGTGKRCVGYEEPAIYRVGRKDDGGECANSMCDCVRASPGVEIRYVFGKCLYRQVFCLVISLEHQAEGAGGRERILCPIPQKRDFEKKDAICFGAWFRVVGGHVARDGNACTMPGGRQRNL